ncbi:D-alanyl-D-alanine carboxypeptidase/D-alanyl-D-alanine-endopeptidase [Streptomyces sp. R302]|uniref:D-alanyl-D-alanine carboxypeptidase/D-alanyl-D-alanine endopeptidase n=1 Tax=unclassified Streptomyces TaxID=2593676 RepID=UPI00145E42BB|nr:MULTISPECIES: D-alanyl-D-alanine carboxypeptidase/D-alanyl-D-alanine-endopeptidase [unclassified Streptomyces]NML52112.1 D-alanyl-D-alanine carboxypeptidase/D-alanyl-D-alanine-endopeptidase [Streptomyces sp. R301]NML82422.1 D-alanyl-D-alanine carboxypeptidase/D-alanyl-D-alanine-endopeptidase [Streptomyces sp. R302]
MPEPRVWQLTAGSAVLGLVLAAAAVTAAGPWDGGQRTAERARAAAPATGGEHHPARTPGQAPTPAAAPAAQQRPEPAPAPSAPDVLAAVSGPDDGTLPTDLARTLVPLLADPGLGTVRTASVVDAATGRQLYGEGAVTPMTPASTVKLATAAAALSALGADHRIATTVTATPDGKAVTLTGGGDPTLDDTRLKALARDTARALTKRGHTSVRLAYDTGLYQGPVLHPIGPNENLAPVTALMTRGGRLDDSTAGPAPRSGDPARDTATAFAAHLADAGVKVTGAPAPGRTPKGAPLARTHSAPLADLVERTLTHSDNDLAEALARQTALARKQPASFAGAEKAVRAELARRALPVTGARFADGSGLDRRDRVSALLLTTLLSRAAGDSELRPLLTGLPVGGFTGTLAGRYGQAPAGAGLVRAKTGTLTGVNTLAGTVVTAEGRLLAFAFLAGRTPSPDLAQPALDRLSAALTGQK